MSKETITRTMITYVDMLIKKHGIKDEDMQQDLYLEAISYANKIHVGYPDNKEEYFQKILNNLTQEQTKKEMVKSKMISLDEIVENELELDYGLFKSDLELSSKLFSELGPRKMATVIAEYLDIDLDEIEDQIIMQTILDENEIDRKIKEKGIITDFLTNYCDENIRINSLNTYPGEEISPIIEITINDNKINSSLPTIKKVFDIRDNIDNLSDDIYTSQYIYHIQEYNNIKKLYGEEWPLPFIRVTDLQDNNVGYVCIRK